MGWGWKLWKGYKSNCPAKWHSQQVRRGLDKNIPISLKTLRRNLAIKWKRCQVIKTDTPKFLIVRPMTDSSKIFTENQKGFCLGVFLMKRSRANIANVTKVQSKANNDKKPSSICELLKEIRHVLNNNNLFLKLEPTGDTSKHWEIICFSNSNYVGDPDDSRSISDFILFILGGSVSWWSKVKQSMMLSSSEAEWVALSEDAKEVMFMIQLLGSMKISVKLPVQEEWII